MPVPRPQNSEPVPAKIRRRSRHEATKEYGRISRSQAEGRSRRERRRRSAQTTQNSVVGALILSPRIQGRLRRWSGALGAALLLALSVSLTSGQSFPQVSGDEPPLPTDVIVDVDAVESQSIRIGIPNLLGSGPETRLGGDILRNDFTLFPGFRVVGPDALSHDLNAEGLAVRPGSWSGLGVDGVIKGRVRGSGNQISVEMRFFRLAQPARAAVTADYRGSSSRLRHFMHDFGNKVLREMTGKPGPFGTHIAYAQRQGRGRKDVMCADMDGHGIMRVSNGRGVAMLPAFDDGGEIWFTRLTRTGMFITKAGSRGRRILESDGLTMAPAICNGRVFFASSREGNSEIYSARLDGSDVRRLTNHPAIDVSPSCGPNRKLVWVSARHGTPQIFIMNQDGSSEERLTFKGNHNQTPSFCRDASVPLVAFTGRDGPLDIFTVDVRTKEIRRLTQGQGNNKDPAFSRDCRMVAFTSDRRGAPGIYVSSTLGFNQHRVVNGEAETVRWVHR